MRNTIDAIGIWEGDAGCEMNEHELSSGNGPLNLLMVVQESTNLGGNNSRM